MPDDIITFGGPERRSRRDADEAIESLFHAHYPRVVYTAFSLVGDWDLAEQLAQEAYLRLWRRWRWISDPQAAPMYLQRTVVNLSRETIRRRVVERRVLRARELEPAAAQAPDAAAVAELRRAVATLPMRKRECVVLRYLLGLSEAETAKAGEDRDMTDTDLERRLRDLRQADLPAGATGPPIDAARAWRDFQELRSRSAAIRHRAMAAAALVLVAAAAMTVPALAGRGPGSPPPRPGASTSLPAATRTYPGAVAARYQLSGVTAVVGDAGHAWVIRNIGTPGEADTYQLAGINLQTNSVMFRAGLGRQPRAIASGDGRLWLTTGNGQQPGQIVRVDLATGQVLSTVHLAAGPCEALSFGSGHLFALCEVGGLARTAVWRINPVTQQAFRLTRTIRGYVDSFTATSDATLWYTVNYFRIAGLTNTGGNPQPVTAGYQDQAPGWPGLAYDAGSIWALSSGERLARIDAFTGRVTQVFTYRNYDPGRAGGLDFLTAGGGWLWFLDNGYPFSGVLRVSEATGRPAGGVAIAPNSCGQQSCSQIYFTPGSVWVPTAELLIRISPARLPG